MLMPLVSTYPTKRIALQGSSEREKVDEQTKKKLNE